MAKALKINARDNVAVLMADVGAGETVEVVTDTGTLRLQARQAIGFGHKIALGNLTVHQPIIKYGEEIGCAQAAIAAGDWIHLHNVYCRRGHETET
ncbi:MAG: UxaA family hydrolase [Proteobacteria bacterium]|nr:UxaA family hydrolase [Pseudomonadota bacterium]MBU2228590.1 UxaA family hydrolase [Pseudomonadota bacterium]MBU2261828.1 UxaA family hydrolase [Pseudomonadota bacterium]